MHKTSLYFLNFYSARSETRSATDRRFMGSEGAGLYNPQPLQHEPVIMNSKFNQSINKLISINHVAFFKVLRILLVLNIHHVLQLNNNQMTIIDV